MDQLFLSLIPLKDTHSLVNNEFHKICREKICCETFVKYKAYDIALSKLGYVYRLSIFSGREDYMNGIGTEKEETYEMHCAIVACTKDTSDKCGSRFFPSDNVVPSVKFIEIRMSMSVELSDMGDEDLMVMPTNVDIRLLPLRVDSFSFTASEIYNKSK